MLQGLILYSVFSAKLQPNCPKPERPARQNAKREAVESGLAAAAAKLATLPVRL